MKSLSLAVLAGLALAAVGCSGKEAEEAPTGTKSNSKFEMSGEAGADSAGASANAKAENEAGDN